MKANETGEASSGARNAATRDEIFSHFDRIEMGMILMDPVDRSVLWANHAMRQLLGSAPDIQRFCSAITPEDLESRKVERHSSTLGGREFGYSIYPAPPAKLILCRDISEPARRERIAESLEATALLGRAFLAFRHEIGNPLNSMKTALTVLSENWDRLPRELTSDFLTRSIEEIRRIERFLAQLAFFVKSETLNIQEVDINGVLEDLAVEVSRVFSAVPRLRFEVRRDPKGSKVRADVAALTRCLLALTQNSLEAVSGKDAPKVELRAYAAGGQVRVEVWDNGPGIPAEIKQSLFKPFVTSKSQGLGLGLAVTRRTLSEMGAAIDLTSDSAGTTATVVFTLEEGPL